MKNLGYKMFEKLQKINQRPEPFEFYTTPLLWDDEHVSKKMLEFHLGEDSDLASRKKVFIDRSLNWITSRFKVATGTRICDFGCGPGLYTTAFAEQGAIVTGIDFSRRSLNYAQDIATKKKLNIEYILQNYLDFTTDKKFDLITMIFCDFCVLSPEQRKTLLRKFYEYLAPNGTILFDVFSLKQFESTTETCTYEYSGKDGFWAFEPYYVFQNILKYEREKLILHKYSIIEKTSFTEIYNWLQCYSPETITSTLKESGLQIIECHSNVAGDKYNLDSNEIAVVAGKI